MLNAHSGTSLCSGGAKFLYVHKKVLTHLSYSQCAHLFLDLRHLVVSYAYSIASWRGILLVGHLSGRRGRRGSVDRLLACASAGKIENAKSVRHAEKIKNKIKI